MRRFSLALVLCLPAAAQQQSQTSTYLTDLNGRRTLAGISTTTQSGNTTGRTEWLQSINGRQIPLQTTEEKVISQEGNTRVVERMVRRYDPNGNPGALEKQQIQERKNADGSVSSTVSVYRSDINGNMQLAERVITDASKSGNTINANVSIERASINGTFDVAER